MLFGLSMSPIVLPSWFWLLLSLLQNAIFWHCETVSGGRKKLEILLVVIVIVVIVASIIVIGGYKANCIKGRQHHSQEAKSVETASCIISRVHFLTHLASSIHQRLSLNSSTVDCSKTTQPLANQRCRKWLMKLSLTFSNLFTDAIGFCAALVFVGRKKDCRRWNRSLLGLA